MLAEYGILFVSDEVQTGWGRTGEHFWGYQAHGITPDALTFAKGIGNGIAIGGVVARRELMDCLQRPVGLHVRRQPAVDGSRARRRSTTCSSTTCRQQALRVGTLLREGLEKATAQLQMVGDVRGKGLMIGVELVRPGTTEPDPPRRPPCMERAREGGLLIGKGGLYGNCLRVAPPLTLTEDEAREGLAILTDALHG